MEIKTNQLSSGVSRLVYTGSYICKTKLPQTAEAARTDERSARLRRHDENEGVAERSSP